MATTNHTMPSKAKTPVTGEPLLSPSLLLRALRAKGVGDASGDLRLFSYARYALATLLMERGADKGTLFAPSYICDDAVAPLPPLGQSVRYYPVREGLEPDWEWLESRVNGGGNALLLVHYFGFPNALDSALEFCRSHGLTLIEDCAHSFLTRYRGKIIGTIGDAGFYSFRKLLPIPDGAGLVTGGGTPCDGTTDFQRTRWAQIARQLLKYGIYRSRGTASLLGRLRARQRVPTSLASAPQPRGNGRHGISRMSYKLMKTLEPEHQAIYVRRRENYLYLLDAFSNFPEAVPLYPALEEETCPYAFPLLLADRSSVQERLLRIGVPAHPWPGLPSEVAGNSDFPMANRYADQVMLLPVHQGLDANHLQRIVEGYQRVRAA